MTRRTSPKSAKLLIPLHPTIPALQKAAKGCQACDLWKRGTQTVFGEGRPDAKVIFVGEQPGDREDLEGKPFVGPAGGLLDRALVEAGIDRKRVYVTNAVKHFKWARAANAAFTKNQTPPRLPPAAHGWRRKLPFFGPR